MNPKLTIVSALALLVPTVAPAVAFAQDWPSGGYPYGRTPLTPSRGFTEMRITPPPGGEVLVYDGLRLIGRFDRPSGMSVASGRNYHVVAMRGDQQVWAGDVMASGMPLDLGWGPPSWRGYAPGPYQAPPSWRGTSPGPSYRGQYPAPPSWRGYAPGPYEAPQANAPGGWTAPVISNLELRSLLRDLDMATDDNDRLDAVADAISRNTFTAPQADIILGRFHSDAYRLAALERLNPRIVDRENAQLLLRRFRSPSSRQQAQDMIGW